MAVSVDDGGFLIKDPSDSAVYAFDWDDHLATGASIATATFTITAIRPSGDTALTKDQESASSRAAQVRLTAGTVGAVYRLDCKVVTDETPAQTIERSIKIKVEQQ